MHEKQKKSSVEKKKIPIEERQKLFPDRFKRLKSAYGVKSDSALSGKLGCVPQSVAGAKHRQIMPVSWLEEVGRDGYSLDYVFYGDLPVKRKDAGVESDTSLDIDPEGQIAERLVSMAISETGFSPSQAGKKILERFIKRKVAGDVKADVIEMLKDVMMSERESETSDDTE
jgi:hypothetical protein